MSRALVLFLALALAGACRTATTVGEPLGPKEQAHLLLQRGDGRGAVDLLERLHAGKPDDLSIARMLCEAHVKAGTAEALLARLATRKDAISHYMQGLVRFGRAADTARAVADFRRAVELSPGEPEFHYRLGVALLESEQYDDALAALKKATSLAPDRTGWSLPLAKALYRTGDSKAAVNAVRVVVTGGPSPAEVKTARALMDQLADPFAGFPRAARPQLEQAIQWLEVADVPQQAIVQLEELLRDYPDQPAVHTLLGVAWARLDDAGRAVEELKRAIELAPDDGKNHLYLAELYVSRQRPKSAEEHYQKAIDRNPVLDEAWFKLGDLALERQDYGTARRDFEIAAHLNPESSPARGKLALVHQLEGNWPAADRELRAVLDREPENLEFMLRLGVLHTERFTKAKSAVERDEAAREASTWLQKVLDAQPENALASRALERLKAR